jgi:hypothetical protein
MKGNSNKRDTLENQFLLGLSSMNLDCLSSDSNIVANLKNQKLCDGTLPYTFSIELSIIIISPIAILLRETSLDKY